MSDVSRRQFIAGAASVVAFRDDTLARLNHITRDAFDPSDDAQWKQFRTLFDFDPTLIPFNNIGLHPSPRTVLDAQISHLKRANLDPSYIIWRQQDKALDGVRKDLAELLGAKSDDLALVPNATYGLQTVIMGLDVAAGDEILFTTHEYPRVMTAATQRAKRDKVQIVEVPIATPPLTDEEVVRRILEKVTPRTKLVVLSRITYLIGQILPIRPIADALAKRGIPLLVDGAQSIALLPDTMASLNTQMYVACLHKWLMGPVGTGIMVIKPPMMRSVWPLHPADDDLRDRPAKFEQIGSHGAAPFLALRESIDLHNRITLKAKADRLEVLRQRLAAGFADQKGVHLQSSLDPNVCRAALTVGFSRVRSPELAGWLLSKHKIHVTTSVRADVNGIRISPSLFTTFEEVDRLANILRGVATNGI